MQIVETTGNSALSLVDGLGDLSHASAVFSRDGRFAFVFGRDGGLTKVDMLHDRIVARVIQSGVNIANIDNLGNVHPDTMWWDHGLGNVKERRFSEIWEDTSDPLMAGLKQRDRPLEGRCAACRYLSICGANSRTRAWQLTGNPWAEDPGCYLSNTEIGVNRDDTERLLTRPYRGATKLSRRQL